MYCMEFVLNYVILNSIEFRSSCWSHAHVFLNSVFLSVKAYRNSLKSLRPVSHVPGFTNERIAPSEWSALMVTRVVRDGRG